MPDRDDAVLLLDQKVEDRLFRALLEFPELSRLLAGQLDESDFSTSVKANLFRVLSWHWETLSDAAPTADTLRVEAEELIGGMAPSMIDRYLETLHEIPCPPWAWIVHHADEWIRKIKLHRALFDAADRLRSGSYDDAQQLVVSAIREGGIRQQGLANDLELSDDELAAVVDDRSLFVSPTRIYALDEVIGGMFRQELLIVLAGLNTGKTWAANHLGNAGLFGGAYVLHMTLEMNRQRALQRYLQTISGFVRPHHRHERYREVELWSENFRKRERVDVQSLLHLGDLGQQLDNLRAFGGALAVRDYPSGLCGLSDIEREIELFEVTHERPPDIVIVDGLGDMNVGRERREGLTTITRGLRAIAHEKRLAMVATHQANRPALNVEIVEPEHTGENIAIMQIADTGISLNQTKDEAARGIMRVFVMRARNAKKWQLVECFQNLEIGQFCQESRLIDLTQPEVESPDDPELPRRRRGRFPDPDRIKSRLENRTTRR